MTRWLVVLGLFALACSSKHSTGPGSGTGSGTTPAIDNATTCDDVRPRIEQLYRSEAEAKEPKRIEEAVADNTAMVMRDCAIEPAKFVPCIAKVPSVAELERQCLVPLDDDGTEGER